MTGMRALGLFAVLAALSFATPGRAQSVTDTTPAKQLFGAVKGPAEMKPQSFGFYSKGCLGGAEMLPINGPTWQAMRLSRNRNWGHPELINFLERFSAKVPKVS